MYNALKILKDNLNKIEVSGQENMKNLLFCMELVDRMSNAMDRVVKENDSNSKGENIRN